MKKHSTKVYNIIDDIESLPGLKIVTLSDGNSLDFEEDGTCEYLDNFMNSLEYYILTKKPVGITVRQFTKEFVEMVRDNGKLMNIPRKNIYMLAIHNGKIAWANDETCFECYYRDFKTGDILEIQEDITCCGFNSKHNYN